MKYLLIPAVIMLAACQGATTTSHVSKEPKKYNFTFHSLTPEEHWEIINKDPEPHQETVKGTVIVVTPAEPTPTPTPTPTPAPAPTDPVEPAPAEPETVFNGGTIEEHEAALASQGKERNPNPELNHERWQEEQREEKRRQRKR